MFKRMSVVMIVVMGLLVSAALVSACPCPGGSPGPECRDLRTANWDYAGFLKVWNDCANLYVEYQTDDGWMLEKTHLHVATALADIPQTKKGEPEVKRFDYRTKHKKHDHVTEYTYEIPIEWAEAEGTELYIAAHVVVQCEKGGKKDDDHGHDHVKKDDDHGHDHVKKEEAWVDGERLPGASWAMYMTYTVQ